MNRKLVLWPFRYADMGTDWNRPMRWLADAYTACGYRVLAHPDFRCAGLEAETYDPQRDRPADTVIYNHADVSELIGNILPARRNLFFKPTVPESHFATLDPLGYGPFSSVHYRRPDLESLDAREVERFLATKVRAWIDGRVTKWGSIFSDQHVEFDDYWLILGQCGGDSVNVRHDFGHYYTKLIQVATELVRIDPGRPLVVKLHPYTDGHDGKLNPVADTRTSDWLHQTLTALGPKVHVVRGMVSVQSLLPGARAVLLGNSGAGFEAMMHGKPIIAWGAPEYHWVGFDLRHLAALVQAIRLDWFRRDLSDRFLFWYLERYCFWDAASALRRVLELERN